MACKTTFEFIPLSPGNSFIHDFLPHSLPFDVCLCVCVRSFKEKCLRGTDENMKKCRVIAVKTEVAIRRLQHRGSLVELC